MDNLTWCQVVPITKENKMQNSISIASSAMLVDLNIKSWTANITDRNMSDEVNVIKNATAKVAKVTKNLFAGTSLLADINKFDASIRLWHQSQTLPWSDRGARLLAAANFFNYKQTLSHYEMQRNDMVEEFKDRYEDLVKEAENVLVDMFVASDYPPKHEIIHSFSFRYSFLPVPAAGDFRVDVGNEAMEELQKQYETALESRIQTGVEEIYGRLRDSLVHMSTKLEEVTEPANGEKVKKRRIHDSMITNARDLCDVLKHLNLTQDPKLEEARRRFNAVVNSVDTEDLKESEEVRSKVKSEVDDILSKFNF
jgi:F0F1-type ATP synthase membrane subunit b/b'